LKSDNALARVFENHRVLWGNGALA
jgi:hypothetical protein